MVVTVTGLTRNLGEDFTTSAASNRIRGFVYWNEYWRAVEWNTGLLRAMGDDGTTESAQNIDLDTILGFVSSGSRFISGLTTDGTNLIALEKNETDQIITIHVINTSNEVVSSNQITIPTGITGLSGTVNSIAYDTNTQNVWVGYNGTTGNRVRFINYSTDGTNISNGFLGITGHISSTGSTIWNGILFSGSSSTDRLYAYELNGSNISAVNNTTTDSVQGLGKRGNILFASDQNNSVDAYDIDFTSVPDAPTGLSGTATSSTVSLTWDDPDDDTITGYEISRKTGSGSYSVIESDTGSNAQSYADTTVAADTTYTYKIQAINDTGDSADSNEFPITTASTATVPDTPTGLGGTQTHEEVNLMWDDPSDDTITGYRIFRRIGTAAYTTLVADTASADVEYTDSTVSAETTYTYIIRATNATGNSGNSTSFSITTDPTPDTTAPTILTAVPASAAVTEPEVSWRVTFSEDVENVDTTDFAIRQTGVPQEDPDSITVVSASVYDVFYTLPDVGIYHFRIRNNSNIADLSGNERTQSGEIPNSTITYTAAATVPEDPTGLDGSAVSSGVAPSEVTLTWDDPSDDTITGYKIFRKTGTAAYTTLVDDTGSDTQSYIDDTVDEGTTYTYKIQAINDTGNSGDSNEFEIRTIKHYTVSLSDSLSVTDAVTRLKAATRSLTDSISLSDSVTRSKLSNTIRTLADSLSISDAVTRIRATTVHLTEDSATSTTSQAITVNADKSPDLDITDASVGDVSGATHNAPSFNVGSQDSSPSGITFSPDGLKMFVIGFSTDSVYSYSLTTAWDTTTATYDSKSFSISDEDTSPSDVAFSPTDSRCSL